MDYHAIHGHDVASFGMPSTGLPSLSAAQALQEIEAGSSKPVSTGLSVLDKALSCDTFGDDLDPGTPGGIQRGQVTEIWGPPGSGKTSLGLQLASNVLREGQGVVWVDGFHTLCSQRLGSITKSAARLDVEGEAGSYRMSDFAHFSCPTIPHFIALLCQPIAAGLPESTSLIVIDSLSTLVNHAFPKIPDLRSGSLPGGGNRAPTLATRRIQALQYIITALQKLAASRDVAIAILTQCATKMQAERGATLVPAITATVWESGISTRLVLFRDWIWDGDTAQGLHFAGVQKLNGKSYNGSIQGVASFKTKAGGLVEVTYDASQGSVALSSTPVQKRKLRETNFEIADSDDEDYGWGEEHDNAAPAVPMPSQWQGSEDLILGTQPPTDAEEDEGEGEDTISNRDSDDGLDADEEQ